MALIGISKNSEEVWQAGQFRRDFQDVVRFAPKRSIVDAGPPLVAVFGVRVLLRSNPDIDGKVYLDMKTSGVFRITGPGPFGVRRDKGGTGALKSLLNAHIRRARSKHDVSLLIMQAMATFHIEMARQFAKFEFVGYYRHFVDWMLAGGICDLAGNVRSDACLRSEVLISGGLGERPVINRTTTAVLLERIYHAPLTEQWVSEIEAEMAKSAGDPMTSTAAVCDAVTRFEKSMKSNSMDNLRQELSKPIGSTLD